MAITLNGGHVARALDFYNSPGKYFIFGGTTAWTLNEAGTTEVPEVPLVTDFKLKNVIGLRKIDTVKLVIPDDSGSIEYGDKHWKSVLPNVSTTVGTAGVTKNSKIVPVASLTGILAGVKLRIGNIYEGKVQSVDISGRTVTLDKGAPENIPAGSSVLGGAIVENAKYVYLSTTIDTDDFPDNVSYRQIGLCTGVTPNNKDVLLSSTYATSGANEYTNIGVLELLENRSAVSLSDLENYDVNTVTMIIEF